MAHQTCILYFDSPGIACHINVWMKVTKLTHQTDGWMES